YATSARVCNAMFAFLYPLPSHACGTRKETATHTFCEESEMARRAHGLHAAARYPMGLTPVWGRRAPRHMAARSCTREHRRPESSAAPLVLTPNTIMAPLADRMLITRGAQRLRRSARRADRRDFCALAGGAVDASESRSNCNRSGRSMGGARRRHFH